jgi:hypothetical protein
MWFWMRRSENNAYCSSLISTTKQIPWRREAGQFVSASSALVLIVMSAFARERLREPRRIPTRE